MAIYNLNGVSIDYDIYGDGPDLVFFHGYTCNREDWRWTADQLSKSYRVLLFDFRCHGHSEKKTDNLNIMTLTEEACQFLHGLRIEKPVIIGHSMGGMIALEYGLHFPQEVKALVLAEAHTHIDTTAQLIGSGVVDERTQPDIAQKINENMEQGSQYVTEELFNSLLDFDVREQVCKLKMPILFLWGDRYGDLTPERWPMILEEFGFHNMPNLTAKLIPNSYHFIMLEQLLATLEAIQHFVQQIDA